MTINVLWDKKVKRGKGNRQVWNGTINLVHSFVQSIGGALIIPERNLKKIPMLDGMTEWALKKYNLTLVVNYGTSTNTYGHLTPNPMIELEPNWSEQFVPHLGWYYKHSCRVVDPTKDQIRQFMDPVFVGPRTPADKQFFKVQALKLTLRRKHDRPSSPDPWKKCQTPELARWGADVETASNIFKTSGSKSANEWAVQQGYEDSNFWQEHNQRVDSFDITMPGCEGKPDTYEKLLFVMKFSDGTRNEISN
jgi:hypothetical protein